MEGAERGRAWQSVAVVEKSMLKAPLLLDGTLLSGARLFSVTCSGLHVPLRKHAAHEVTCRNSAHSMLTRTENKNTQTTSGMIT